MGRILATIALGLTALLVSGGIWLGTSSAHPASAGVIKVDELLETHATPNSFGNVVSLEDGLGVIGQPIILGTVAVGSNLSATYPNVGVDLVSFGICGNTVTSFASKPVGGSSVTASTAGDCTGCVAFGGSLVLAGDAGKSALNVAVNGTDCPPLGGSPFTLFLFPLPFRILQGTFTTFGSGTLDGMTSSGRVTGWIFNGSSVFLHLDSQN